MQPDYSPLIDALYAQLGALAPLAVFVVVFLVALKFLGRLLGGGRGRRRQPRATRGGWTRRGRQGAQLGGQRRWPAQSHVVAGSWEQPWRDPVPGGSRMPDAADQLRTVMGAEFKPKRLLNRGESRVLAALEPIVAELALPGG